MDKIIYQRIFILIICVAAFIGYAQPAVSVHLKFLGITRTFDYGISKLFENESINLGESDVSDILSENEAVNKIGKRIIISVASYAGALILFSLSVLLSFFAKKRGAIGIFISSAAIVLHIISSRVILTVPELVEAELQRIISEPLGFLSRLINIQGVLEIEIGFGYWISFLAILIHMIFVTIRALIEKNKKYSVA